MLDFIGGAAPAPQPSARWLGLTDINGTELSINGYSRVSGLFAPAASPQGSVSISVAAILVLFDGSAVGANALVFGSFTSARLIPNNGGLIVPTLEIMIA
jgi:hypothetical protein